MSRPIDAEELLRAMDSHDKFGIDPHGYIRRISGDKYKDLVPYVHYKDMIEAVENMPTIHAIPIDKVKATREEMESRLYKGIPETTGFTWQNLGINMCLEILDKLIAESEGQE